MTTSPAISPAAMSIAAFCAAVGIGKTHAYAEVKAGRIVIIKSGRRTLVRADEPQRYLARLEAAK